MANRTLSLTLVVLVQFWFVGKSFADTPGLVEKAPKDVRSVKTDRGYMIPYKVELSDKVIFEMIPIPGGKFKLGSPDSEKGRKPDEGPQVEVEIAPFWMGKCEVTWGEFELYMKNNDSFRKPDGIIAIEVNEKNRVDAVTAPSKLYDPTYVFEFGEDPMLPAVSMTQFSARQYTKWLSKRTELIYRLPNEAEWEYACRAGSTSIYSHGDDVKKLADYAWTVENAGEKPHKVGSKKPNDWGLYDMHGNVMEWTLDAYSKVRYAKLIENEAKKSQGRIEKNGNLRLTNWPTEWYPRVLRGGCFQFASDQARCAARAADHKDWSDTDCNRPKSPWWYTDDPCRAAGFRIVRQLADSTEAKLIKCWEVDNEMTKEAVERNLSGGRGEFGIPSPIRKDMPKNSEIK